MQRVQLASSEIKLTSRHHFTSLPGIEEKTFLFLEVQVIIYHMRWLKEMTLKYNSHEKENTKWVSFVCLCALRQVNTRKSVYFYFSESDAL